MSSTKRSTSREFHISDHYRTDKQVIRDFLQAFISDVWLDADDDILILDPCAGGDKDKGKDMPYVEVLKELGFDESMILSIDIRPNSPADWIKDYLKMDDYEVSQQDLIISNPPFLLALEFIQKALKDVRFNGYVIMFLRLNFFGSQNRGIWLKQNMPEYCYIHSKRPSFIDEPIPTGEYDKDGKERIYKAGMTDSIEYAHFVWRKGYHPQKTLTSLIL